MSELRTNQIFPRDGLASAAIGGGIIQVVQEQKLIQSKPNSTNRNNILTLTATITPTSSSNLIECKSLFVYR